MTLNPFTTTKDQLETYIYNSTKFHEILSSSNGVTMETEVPK
jgi:hypothetical protein